MKNGFYFNRLGQLSVLLYTSPFAVTESPEPLPLQVTGSTVKPPPQLGSKPVMLSVDAAHEGQRLDNFLVGLLKGVPKSHIYRLIRKGEVRINKGRVKQTTRLNTGDLLRVPPVRLPSREGVDAAALNAYRYLLGCSLFEDDAILVINKPSGTAVHAGSGIDVGVIEALRGLRSDLPYLELAHRLDRATSGALVMAKKASVLKALNHSFAVNSGKQKRVRKHYTALVKGNFRQGQRRVTKSLDTEARLNGERHVKVSQTGSYACSVLRPQRLGSLTSLIDIELLTGRTHQARVHCFSEGHPIAGDDRYGDPTFNLKLRQEYGLRRLFLHATSIEFDHPISGQSISVGAPLPEELERVVDALNMTAVP